MGVIVSSYSLATAFVLYNLALVLIYFLRRKNSFMARCGTEVLLFITLLAVIRLLSPVDFPLTYIVRSEKLIPTAKSALEFKLFAAVKLEKLILGIWLIGACWFVRKYVLELHTALRSRKAYVYVRNEAAEQAVRSLGIKYTVLVSAQVLSPYTAGYFRPVIYLPDMALSQSDWEYILRHEAQHIKAHDVWIKLFYAMLEAVMWVNPVSHLFMHELDEMLELRCDAVVVSKLSGKERLDYLGTIAAVARELSDNSVEVANAHFARSEEFIKERFARALAVGKQTNKRIKYAVYTAALVVFCLSYFVVIQPGYRPSFDEAAGMSTNYENMTINQFILFDGEKYTLYVDNAFSKNLSVTDLAKKPYNTLPIFEEKIG